MKRQNKLIALTIIILGVIISTGIFVGRTKIDKVTEDPASNIKTLEIQPVSRLDHIMGNPKAKVIVLEFGDLECPYCQQFHFTMKRIMQDYGDLGQVAWVYRHYPAENHENSMLGANASECFANIDSTKNNQLSFWNYIDKIFSKNEVDLSKSALIKTAVELGANFDNFKDCLNKEDFKTKIERDIADVDKLIEVEKKFMTPYSLIISNTGMVTSISGAASYEDMSSVIDSFIN